MAERTVEPGRGFLGKTSLAAAALSAVGLVVILVAGWIGIEGAREGEQGPLIFEVLWVTFLVGGVLALVLGLVALVVGARRGDRSTRSAGLLAVAYAVLAVLVFLVT